MESGCHDMNLRATLDFLLYQWLDVGSLNGRERFKDHSRETFDAVLDTCERIAREKYAPFNRLVDVQEPRTETEPDGSLRVVLPQATHDAQAAYAGSGMLSASQDEAIGGMQLPYTVEAAANSFLANTSFCMGVPCVISRLALPVVSMPEPMLTEAMAKKALAAASTV